MTSPITTHLTTHFLELSQDLICIADFDGYLKDINPVWERLLRYSRKELLSKPFLEFIHPEDCAKTDKEISKLSKAKSTIKFENRLLAKDGAIKHILWTATPNDKEKIFYATGRDISEQKLAEQAQKESEERLNLVIKGSNDAPWDWDYANSQMYYSPQWWAQIGYQPDELPGNDQLWYNLAHPEDRVRIDKTIEKVLTTDLESYELEFRLKHKDGHYVPLLSRGYVSRDKDGNTLRVTGSNMDLTERKQAEEAVRNSEELLRITLSNISDPLFITDDKGKFFYICPNVSNSLGFSIEEIQKMENISKLLGGDLFSLEELRKQEEITNLEYSVTDKSGKEHDFLINIKKVRIGWGTLLFTLHEITELKQAEKEIQVSLKFFESMDRINGAIQRADNFEQMMGNVLDKVLSIFDCDRAYLVHSTGPDLESWIMPVVRYRPEYPVAYSNKPIPTDPLARKVWRGHARFGRSREIREGNPISFGGRNIRSV